MLTWSHPLKQNHHQVSDRSSWTSTTSPGEVASEELVLDQSGFDEEHSGPLVVSV